MQESIGPCFEASGLHVRVCRAVCLPVDFAVSVCFQYSAPHALLCLDSGVRAPGSVAPKRSLGSPAELRMSTPSGSDLTKICCLLSPLSTSPHVSLLSQSSLISLLVTISGVS